MPAPTKMIAPALAQRLGDDLGAERDALLLALDRGDDLAVLGHHQLDDVRGRRACRWPSVAGLMASVGSACHFERNAMWGLRERRGTPRRRDCRSAGPAPRAALVYPEPPDRRVRAPDAMPAATASPGRRARRGAPARRRLPGSPPGRAPSRRPHARELCAATSCMLARFAAGLERPVEALTRAGSRGIRPRPDGRRARAAFGRARRRLRRAASTGTSS